MRVKPPARPAILPALLALALALGAGACGGADGRDDTRPSGRAPSEPPRPTAVVSGAGTTPEHRARCGSSLQAVVDAAAPRATLDLTGCTYGAGAIIDRPLTIIGAIVELPVRTEAERWVNEIVIRSSDVTIVGLTTSHGANVIAIEGPFHGTVVRDADMRDQVGSGIWIKGAASDTLLERITVITDPSFHPSTEPGVSPIRVEGCLGPFPCEPLAGGTTIRDSYVDQGAYLGAGGPGWFGIELIRAPDSIVEGSTILGGHTRISLPNSDRTIVRDNVLDMRNGAWWGVEVAGSLDVVIRDNIFDGGDGGRRDGVAAISFNATSGRTPTGAVVSGNVIRDLDAAFQLSGDTHRISGNCLVRVGRVYYAYGGKIGPGVDIDPTSVCSGVAGGSSGPVIRG